MFNKFVLIISVIFFSLSAANADEYWLRQQSPTTKWLFRCSFPDTLNGWAVGDSGVVIHTSNGSTSWTVQNSSVFTFIWSVSFVNIRLGWAVTDRAPSPGSRILRTTNGGLLWTISDFPDSSYALFAVYFLDSINGWTGGSGGNIFQTTNGGLSWTFRPVDSMCVPFPVFNFAFYNYTLGYACGGVMDFTGVVYRTTNSGHTWQNRCVSPEPVYDIFVFDSLNAIGTGGDFKYGVSVITTSNKGGDWRYDTTGVFGKGEAVAFRTRSEGWIAAGFSGRFVYTFDSARTWHQMFSPDTSGIYDISFPDAYHGYAVGYDGTILKYNSALIGIQNLNGNIPSSFKLFQNYPNPFNPKTVISYQLAVNSYVTLTVYDVLGKLVAVLKDGLQRAGEYSLIFTADNLPSGVYFFRLAASPPHSANPQFIESKKMLLLK